MLSVVMPRAARRSVVSTWGASGPLAPTTKTFSTAKKLESRTQKARRASSTAEAATKGSARRIRRTFDITRACPVPRTGEGSDPSPEMGSGGEAAAEVVDGARAHDEEEVA